MEAVVAQKSKKEELQREFKDKLIAFMNDNELTEEYEKFEPRKDRVVVELFKFTADEKTEELGKTEIYVKSSLSGEWKPSSVALSERIFPIGKVIKKGPDVDEDIKVGDLYTVPIDEIEGYDWNPEFAWFMQNFSKQGKKGGMLTVPDDMPQKLPKIEKNWSRYRFFGIDSVVKPKEEEKRLVYLVPQLKLDARYIPEF